jgi:serine/threonine-protein phosphatase PGAM5
MAFRTLFLRVSQRQRVALFSGSALFVADTVTIPCKDFATRTEEVTSHSTVRQSTSRQHKLLHGECFEYQVRTPVVPYPAWDHNWDGSQVKTNSEHPATKTRHILLVRHGQYEQGFPEDSKRILTPLGRRQAELTGQRLAAMTAGHSGRAGEETTAYAGQCRIKSLHVSSMTRAKETASIIALQLKDDAIFVTEPDPLLNEALPSPIIPCRPDVGDLKEQEKEIRENHDRIETAFRKYIHRVDLSGESNETSDHEFEVIVGHANVIRYFLLRALQLPPEAWLRLSLFNCSITYLIVQPNGYVTARLVGDTGHIPYEETTFSGAYGYNWKAPTST